MPPTVPILGVSACLFAGQTVLLVQRSKPPFTGLLGLPGGRVEFGETLEHAVRREIREETGLVVETPVFHRLHEAIGPGFHAVIAVYRANLSVDAEPVAGDDAASCRFIDIGEVQQLEADGRTTPGLASIVLSAIALSR